MPCVLSAFDSLQSLHGPDIEITQARDLDVERLSVRRFWTDLKARHGASMRPSLELTTLGLAAIAARNLIDASAVYFLRSELQLETRAHHAGQKATNRVRLSAGHLHH